MMLETFSGIFPYYTMWNPTRSDTVLVGAIEPYGPDLKNMKDIASRSPVRADLKIVGIESILPILGMQMRDNADRYSHVAWTGAIHSDFFPVLEYAAARGFFVGSQAEGVKRLDLRSQSPVNAGIWLQKYLKEYSPSSSELKNCYALSITDRGLNSRQALCWASLWFRLYPDDHEARIAVTEQINTSHDTVLHNIGRPSVGKKSYVDQKLWCKFAFEDYVTKRNCLDPAAAADVIDDFRIVSESVEGRKDADILRWCGEIMYDLGRYDDAVKYLEPSARIIAGLPGRRGEFDDVATLLIRALLAKGDAARAHELFVELFRSVKSNLKVTLIGAEIDAAIALRVVK